MKKPIIIYPIQFILSVVFCYAQEASVDSGSRIKNKKAIAGFEAVAIEGGGTVYFHHATETRLEIEGDRTRVENTHAEVIANNLSIQMKEGSADNSKLEIHVYTPVLKEIRQTGGGQTEVKEGFAPVKEFTCSATGGGNIDISAIKVYNLSASIDEGGTISAQVNGTLRGKIKGGGTIGYQGHPTVESDISGGGSISQQGSR